MIGHIFKKDLALLWPFVAGLTVLHIVVEVARYHAVVHGDSWEILPPFEVLTLLLWIPFIALVVHQDPLPGTRQDWLTRPIKRVELLLAKLLFLLALLQGPRFAANAADVFAAGFTLPQALGAAAVNGLSILAVLTLPALALAAVTRTMTEFVIGGIILAFISEVAQVLFAGALSLSCGPTCGTSIEWVARLTQLAILVIAALTVLGLQYARRDAIRSARGIAAAAPVLMAALWNLPWGPAFALQQAATGAVEPQDRVTIELDGSPQSPLAPSSASEQAMVSAARASLAGGDIGKLDLRARRRANSTDAVITIPLRVSGLRTDEVVWTDRVAVRLVGPDGRVFRGAGDELEIRGNAGAAQSVLQTFSVPASLFEATRDIELRLEVDYWLTSLEPAATATLAAQDGKAELLSAKCSTGLRRNGENVRFACVGIASPPPCYTFALESSPTGARNPNVLICDPDYGSYEIGPRLFRPFAITAPFPDRAAQPNAVVHVSAYAPRAHSTSRLVVPGLRLADWVTAVP